MVISSDSTSIFSSRSSAAIVTSRTPECRRGRRGDRGDTNVEDDPRGHGASHRRAQAPRSSERASSTTLTGYDHLAFFGGARRRWAEKAARSPQGHHGAFTIAHSASLALAVLGIRGARFALRRASHRPVDCLRRPRELLRPRYRQALAHHARLRLRPRLGFAGALAARNLPARRIPAALLGFNLGVEAGQIVILALVVPVRNAGAAAVCRGPDPARPGRQRRRNPGRARLALDPPARRSALNSRGLRVNRTERRARRRRPRRAENEGTAILDVGDLTNGESVRPRSWR